MPETYVYKKVDNCEISLDFYDSNTKKSPAIIFIHGGALIWGSRKKVVLEQVKLYNNAGYSVFSIDYRLAPETKLEYIVKDIQDALSWIKHNGERLFDIDINRIALVDKEIADNIVKENIDNKRSIAEGSFEERFEYYLYCRQNGIWTNNVSGYDIYKDKDKLMPFCPIHNITKDYPPTLLIHGDKDTDVPYQQSIEMSDKLNQYEVESKIIIAKGQGHVFDYDMSKPVVQDIFDEVLKFLDRNI